MLFFKHIILGLVFGISMSFISWIVGMILNNLLMKTKYYQRFSHLNFIKSSAINKKIGMRSFKWIVKNTFFKFFNQKLKVENRQVDLTMIRNEMTLSEISHLIGFIFVIPFAIYKSFTVGILFGFTVMIPNILMNLYPSLLQQENKRQIDKILNSNKLK